MNVSKKEGLNIEFMDVSVYGLIIIN